MNLAFQKQSLVNRNLSIESFVMLAVFLKSMLSGGLASLFLFCLELPALAQSVDRVRANQLADIAFGYAIANQPTKAIPLLKQAETYGGGDCFEANTWLKIGVGYRAANQPDKADTFLTRAIETANLRTQENCASSGTSPGESLLNRTVDYAEAGHLELAADIAQRAQSWSQPLAMAEIAAEYNNAGQQQQAKQLVTRSIEIARESEAVLDITYANQLLLAAASRLSQLGQPELANFVIEEGNLTQSPPADTATVEQTDLETYQMLALARLFIELEQRQQALALLDKSVLTMQPSPEFPLELIYNQIEAAVLYQQLGSNQADDLWEQATASVQLSEPQMVAFAQVALVRGYTQQTKFEQAHALAKSIENTRERQAAHRAIATAYARAGRVDDANRLVQSQGAPQGTRVEIMRAYLDTEQYAQAQQMAQQPDMLAFLPEVGQAYCQAERPESVLPLLELLEPASGDVDRLRRCAAIELAQQGDFDQALELAQPIADTDHRAGTMIAIATRQAHTATQSSWHQLLSWLPHSVQSWFGLSTSPNAIEILDQALSLVQKKI